MLYRLVLFVHVLSAIGVFVSLGMDWLAVARLRMAATGRQARPWIWVLEISTAIGPSARMLVLTAGLVMAFMEWSWEGWIIAALVGWTVMVVLGEPLTGRGLRAMRADTDRETGTLSGDLRGRLRNPRIWDSVWIRSGIAVGIVFLMVVKPPAIAAVTVVAAGGLLGLAAARWTRRASQPASDRTELRGA